MLTYAPTPPQSLPLDNRFTETRSPYRQARRFTETVHRSQKPFSSDEWPDPADFFADAKPWPSAATDALMDLLEHGYPEQARVMQAVAAAGGRLSRAGVYETAGYPSDRLLMGFTRSTESMFGRWWAYREGSGFPQRDRMIQKRKPVGRKVREISITVRAVPLRRRSWLTRRIWALATAKWSGLKGR